MAAGLSAMASGALAQSTRPVLSGGSMAYVLQADAYAKTRAAAVRKLAACGRDFVVIDMAFDGSPAGAWTKHEVRAIRAGKPGRKVVAYFSVGEAEDYRGYWNPLWDADHDGQPDAGAPAWLGNVNKVQPASHVDPILADLARLQATGKPVWVIEYGTKEAARQRSMTQVPAHGFSLLLTDRNLTTLGQAYPP